MDFCFVFLSEWIGFVRKFCQKKKWFCFSFGSGYATHKAHLLVRKCLSMYIVESGRIDIDVKLFHGIAL